MGTAALSPWKTTDDWTVDERGVSTLRIAELLLKVYPCADGHVWAVIDDASLRSATATCRGLGRARARAELHALDKLQAVPAPAEWRSP